MIDTRYRGFEPRDVHLLPGIFQQRRDLNTAYLLGLNNRNLLQNYYFEARLLQQKLRATMHGEPDDGAGWHWGWETPTCQVRGHFLGHWMSGAARTYAETGDLVLKAKLDQVVAELGRCQDANGGEWAGSIPPSYLEWTARGQHTWAPHYVVHKALMGLHDALVFAGNDQALDISHKWARWFHRWTSQLGRQEMDDLLDVETGGMLEAWANLYGVTGQQEHLDLLQRYDRPRLFEPLLNGEDVLTNRHANTTIPEAQGAARAYEVTGDARWRRIAEAYWRCAVTDRGCFCTGGQNTGEVWTPPFAFAARLGDKTQEHCTVYNMMRLADYLLRWTGEVAYADYIERNTYNGILAQQHPETGMITYWLPLEPGARKIWGSPTNDFWCCHGSLVQAHACHNAYVYYAGEDELLVAGYVPSELRWNVDGANVVVRQRRDSETGSAHVTSQRGPAHRTNRWMVDMTIAADRPVDFALRLRLPWWLAGPAEITINGRAESVTGGPSSYHTIKRDWHADRIRIALPKGLSSCPLPDRPDTMAFMDGPIVLAGLCDEERTLFGDPTNLTSWILPDNEREWGQWMQGYRALGQDHGLRLTPIHQVVDESYTVYFPVREACGERPPRRGR